MRPLIGRGNLEWLAAHRREMPLELVHVDDGYQAVSNLLVFRSRLQDRSAGEVKADGTGSIVAAA